MNKVSKESMDIVKEKISELKRFFPEVIAEGKVDFNKLQRTLGEDIDGKEEKYSFNWAGRKESFKNIQITAKGTLIPSEKRVLASCPTLSPSLNLNSSAKVTFLIFSG